MSDSHELKILRFVSIARGKGQELGAFAEHFGKEHRDINQQESLSVLWQMVGSGLLSIAAREQGAAIWSLVVTARGRKLLDGEKLNPDDRSGYIQAVKTSIPALSPVVERYLLEAANAYWQQLYLASAITLGVASECAFYEMAEPSALWMGRQGIGGDFCNEQNSSRRVFNNVCRAFRGAIDEAVEKKQIPRRLYENVSAHLEAALDLIRTYRNSAAHGALDEISQDSCYSLLQVVARGYLKRVYDFKDFFSALPPGAP